MVHRFRRSHIPVILVVLIYAMHPILLAFVVHLQGHERLTSRKLMLAFTVLVAFAFVLGSELGEFNAIGIGSPLAPWRFVS